MEKKATEKIKELIYCIKTANFAHWDLQKCVLLIEEYIDEETEVK